MSADMRSEVRMSSTTIITSRKTTNRMSNKPFMPLKPDVVEEDEFPVGIKEPAWM